MKKISETFFPAFAALMVAVKENEGGTLLKKAEKINTASKNL